MQYPEPIAKLIESYMKLPGIGSKTATRLAFYTLDMDNEDVSEFAKSLISTKKDLTTCSICGNITEQDPCEICRDKSRDQSQVLVVEQVKDIMVMERMRDFHGLYHVLNGVLSPIEGKVMKILIFQACLNGFKLTSPLRKLLLRQTPLLKVRRRQCIFV